MAKGRIVQKKPGLFIVSDAGVDTGFATVAHNLIDHLHRTWDINVLAINYYGDPHPIQHKAALWSPTGVQTGDVYGFSRLETLLSSTKPDTLLVIQDPWIAAEYASILRDTKGIKRVLYTPIDAKNIKGIFTDAINSAFDHVIGYTQFGVDELTAAGLQLPTSVIPHGINKKDYFPIDRDEVREKSNLSKDFYIVQSVDRNQIRKRIDLALYYFSEWVKRTNKPDNVKFYYHGALRDEGWDIAQLAKYFGIHDRLIVSHENLNPSHGFPLDLMKYVYNVADVKVSATHGEGWGLTTHESMACGIPNIVPEFSALGEWPRGGVEYTKISPIPFFTHKGVNTMAGVADMESTIAALEKLYVDSRYRKELGQKGYLVATQSKFEWSNVAREFDKVFRAIHIGTADDE